MTEDELRKISFYLALLLIASAMLGCGIGGCCEYTGPTRTLLQSQETWQTVWDEWARKPKSEISSPVIFAPLIAVGLVLLVATGIIAFNKET